jgi:hypothetical protein
MYETVKTRGDHKAAGMPHAPRVRHWCDLNKAVCKNNMQVADMHTRVVAKGPLNVFLEKRLIRIRKLNCCTWTEIRPQKTHFYYIKTRLLPKLPPAVCLSPGTDNPVLPASVNSDNVLEGHFISHRSALQQAMKAHRQSRGTALL